MLNNHAESNVGISTASMDIETSFNAESSRASDNNDGVVVVTNDVEKTTLFCSVPLSKIRSVLSEKTPKIRQVSRKLLCLYCDRTFVSTNLLQKHVERCHSEKQSRRLSSRKLQSQFTTTACCYCDKLPVEHSLRQLFEHLVAVHSQKYFGCLTCEERFLNQSLLDDHNFQVHGETVASKKRQSLPKNPKIAVVIDTKQECFPSRETEKMTRSKMRAIQSKPQLRNRKISIKASKINSNKRLQPSQKIVSRKKKKDDPKRADEHPRTHEKLKNISVNPYPEFDHYYRVKKITDHSIDNLKISSLTFDDVFDKAFFNRIKYNIQENLAYHLDGKLFENQESENRISNFEKCPPNTEVVTTNGGNGGTENYGCDLSLNAITPVTTAASTTSFLTTTNFGEDLEAPIEYGSKPSKKKIQPRQESPVRHKYVTRRKYQASILEHKENRDLSKLDMWTQLVIKERQEKVKNEQKTAKEMLEYQTCAEYKQQQQLKELNRILDRRGPFEDLKEEASKQAAMDKLKSQSKNEISDECFEEIRSILDDILDTIVANETTGDSEVSSVDVCEVPLKKVDVPLLPDYLQLRRASASLADEEIDRSDRIALICSSQETENYEFPTNTVRAKNEMVELSGEWARSRIYVCAACGSKQLNMKLLLEHKSLYHQNAWVQHYEFVGNQSGLYRHLCIPGLGKVGHVEDAIQCKIWKRSDARVCTKCGKVCNVLGELHRHILECGGDWTWMLARKKCKYRPFGSRKKKRGLVKRIRERVIIQKTDPPEKRKYKTDGPRQRPSDADTIQRMLANLPPKRSSRKSICMRDGFPRNLKKKQTKPKNQVTKGVNVVRQKPSTTSDKNVRTLRRTLSSKILDTNNTLRVRRHLLKNLNIRTSARQKVANKDEIPQIEGRKTRNRISNTIGEKLTIKNFFPVTKHQTYKNNEGNKTNQTKIDVPKSDEKRMSVELSSKRKLRSSFRKVIDRVKKLKIDSNQVVKEPTEGTKVQPLNSFLGRPTNDKEKLATVLVPLVEDQKENPPCIPAFAQSAIDNNSPTEGSLIPENIFNLEHNSENLLQAKGSPSSRNPFGPVTEIKTPEGTSPQMSPLSVETDPKRDKSPMISPSITSPKVKGKLRKPNRGLNDCIAMLTKKAFEEKKDTREIDNTNEAHKIVRPNECILKIPVFETDTNKNTQNEVLDLSKPKNDFSIHNVLPLATPKFWNPKAILKIPKIADIPKIIPNIKFPKSNSLDETIEQVVKGSSCHQAATTEVFTEICDVKSNGTEKVEVNEAKLILQEEKPSEEEKPAEQNKSKPIMSDSEDDLPLTTLRAKTIVSDTVDKEETSTKTIENMMVEAENKIIKESEDIIHSPLNKLIIGEFPFSTEPLKEKENAPESPAEIVSVDKNVTPDSISKTATTIESSKNASSRWKKLKRSIKNKLKLGDDKPNINFTPNQELNVNNDKNVIALNDIPNCLTPVPILKIKTKKKEKSKRNFLKSKLILKLPKVILKEPILKLNSPKLVVDDNIPKDQGLILKIKTKNKKKNNKNRKNGQGNDNVNEKSDEKKLKKKKSKVSTEVFVDEIGSQTIEDSTNKENEVVDIFLEEPDQNEMSIISHHPEITLERVQNNPNTEIHENEQSKRNIEEFCDLSDEINKQIDMCQNEKDDRAIPNIDNTVLGSAKKKSRKNKICKKLVITSLDESDKRKNETQIINQGCVNEDYNNPNDMSATLCTEETIMTKSDDVENAKMNNQTLRVENCDFPSSNVEEMIESNTQNLEMQSHKLVEMPTHIAPFNKSEESATDNIGVEADSNFLPIPRQSCVPAGIEDKAQFNIENLIINSSMLNSNKQAEEKKVDEEKEKDKPVLLLSIMAEITKSPEKTPKKKNKKISEKRNEEMNVYSLEQREVAQGRKEKDFEVTNAVIAPLSTENFELVQEEQTDVSCPTIVISDSHEKDSKNKILLDHVDEDINDCLSEKIKPIQHKKKKVSERVSKTKNSNEKKKKLPNPINEDITLEIIKAVQEEENVFKHANEDIISPKRIQTVQEKSIAHSESNIEDSSTNSLEKFKETKTKQKRVQEHIDEDIGRHSSAKIDTTLEKKNYINEDVKIDGGDAVTSVQRRSRLAKSKALENIKILEKLDEFPLIDNGFRLESQMGKKSFNVDSVADVSNKKSLKNKDGGSSLLEPTVSDDTNENSEEIKSHVENSICDKTEEIERKTPELCQFEKNDCYDINNIDEEDYLKQSNRFSLTRKCLDTSSANNEESLRASSIRKSLDNTAPKTNSAKEERSESLKDTLETIVAEISSIMNQDEEINAEPNQHTERNEQNQQTLMEIIERDDNEKRKRRRACRVNTYNENELAEAIFQQTKVEKERKSKLNTNELFDLLKATTSNYHESRSTDTKVNCENEILPHIVDNAQKKSKSSLGASRSMEESPLLDTPKTASKVTKKREVDTPIYCDICKKSFKRADNLTKHKTTLTHISKLSELEAKEAEERSKNENCETLFPQSAAHGLEALKIAEIIAMPVEKPPENRPYKSLGERKSFESDHNSNNAGVVLEKQISLLENIMEKKEPVAAIEEESLSSYNFIDSLKLDESSRPVESFPHKDEFLKPDDVSEDGIANSRNVERKVLNRDEELFLECCSLLKCSSEVSNFSKNNVALPIAEEPAMLESQSLSKITEDSSEFSRMATPIGDAYVTDTSNSNTIYSNWGMVNDGIDCGRGGDNLGFDGPFRNVSRIVKKRDQSSSESVTEEDKDSISDSFSKMPTKGALKIFEGLKVSIPTEELNLEEVLNSSPPIKFPSPKTPKNVRKSKPVKNKQQMEDRFLFKMNKKSNLKEIDSNEKILDVYDFEETQDNTDVFVKPDFKTFKTKNEEIMDAQALSSSSSSINSVDRKSTNTECITKKKHMIMGRIFKNVVKPKNDEEIKDLPSVDHNELVENYVLSCSSRTEDEFKRPKMTEEEMNYLFDKLLEKPSGILKKTSVRPKKKMKIRCKKRQRSHSSDSTDDEFGLNKIVKKRVKRKSAKEENNSINLEQELKECIGVASRKSQRKCTSGKQNVLVEYWSSDESAFETFIESQLQELSATNHEEEIRPTVTKKERPDRNGLSNNSPSANRRKRVAAHPLYHWSSSSEDEAQDLIEVKCTRDDLEDCEDEDRPIQHGWIVGDSPKKLVTMLAQAKGKKTEAEALVKEQGGKRKKL